MAVNFQLFQFGPYNWTLPTSGSTLASLTDVATAIATQTGATYANPAFAGYQVSGGIQALSDAGAVDIVNDITKLTTTGANALTLADGTNGQRKEIHMVVDGGDGTLTPTTKTGFTTIVFNDVGDCVVLRFFTAQGWMVISNSGCTIA